ncbi:hypothetical protein HNQ94_003856 [Salirhabdus euzebyi]|uniref:Stressosome-associated protein Prli42 n=1 Tax=Salirhabdus euzebyi TaxID=394506 RepID=A0A841QAD0_9BACI|nr:stressosome-associated protein Prli42 [Salirhabdus euzebyi]MBB6455356.1 hypothetical protein [Salirhabdus euzebyi]
MAKKNNNTVSEKPRVSKRQKRIKFVIYLMILSMILSSILAGAVMFL